MPRGPKDEKRHADLGMRRVLLGEYVSVYGADFWLWMDLRPRGLGEQF